jgi:hypothetical protein
VIASLEDACDDKRAKSETNESVALTPKISTPFDGRAVEA